MKTEVKLVLGVAAAALGIAAIEKIVHDVKKIKKLAHQKEAEIALEAEAEETAAEEADCCSCTVESAVEEAPAEAETAAPEAAAVTE